MGWAAWPWGISSDVEARMSVPSLRVARDMPCASEVSDARSETAARPASRPPGRRACRTQCVGQNSMSRLSRCAARLLCHALYQRSFLSDKSIADFAADVASRSVASRPAWRRSFVRHTRARNPMKWAIPRELSVTTTIPDHPSGADSRVNRGETERVSRVVGHGTSHANSPMREPSPGRARARKT
jgi:hypothetical protein